METALLINIAMASTYNINYSPNETTFLLLQLLREHGAGTQKHHQGGYPHQRVKSFQVPTRVTLPIFRRWTVLTKNVIFTFKERRVYKSPTETIELRRVTGTRSVDCEGNNIFVEI